MIKLAGSISFTSEAVENFRKVTDAVDEKVKQLNETNQSLSENFLAAEAAAEVARADCLIPLPQADHRPTPLPRLPQHVAQRQHERLIALRLARV